MTKVAVIFPSRGLIFSQTGEELLRNLKDIPHRIYFSHRKPIPTCFEEPTQRALKDKDITHLWFVEDDMVLKDGTLKRMLDANANAVTLDYPINEEGDGSVFLDAGGTVVFCGTGCLLVKRKVFDNLKRPIFTDEISWTPLNYGESIHFVGKKVQGGYGGHDITFCFKLWKNGIKIKVLTGELKQRKLKALGKAGSNNGQHDIKVWDKVVTGNRLRRIQAQPVALGAKSKLVTVDTPTGGISTTRKHADNLVKQGLATYPMRRYTTIDDSEVDI